MEGNVGPAEFGSAHATAMAQRLSADVQGVWGSMRERKWIHYQVDVLVKRLQFEWPHERYGAGNARRKNGEGEGV